MWRLALEKDGALLKCGLSKIILFEVHPWGQGWAFKSQASAVTEETRFQVAGIGFLDLEVMWWLYDQTCVFQKP